MTVRDIARRALRSLTSSRVRTLLTALAIAVGAFALTLTLAASNGAQSYADTIVSDNFNPSQLIVTADGGVFDNVNSGEPQEYDQSFGTVINAGGAGQVKMLSSDDITRLRQIDGVQNVQEVSTLSLQYITRDGQRQYVATGQVYDPATTPEVLAGSLSNGLKAGNVIVPEGFLRSLGFANAQSAIGQSLRVAVRQATDTSALAQAISSGDTSALTAAGSDEASFTIAAVSKKPSVVLQPTMALYIRFNQADITGLNERATIGTDQYQKYVSALVTVRDGTDEATLNAVQQAVEKAGYSAQSVADTQQTIDQVIGVLQGIVTVFGLIAVVASVFGVINTMYISVLQRTREIGLMKALGMHKRSVNLLFLFEAGLLGFLGGLIGAGLAYLVGLAGNPFISRMLDLGDARLLQFQAPQIVGLIIGLTVIAVFAGLLPARKAAKLDPITALRSE